MSVASAVNPWIFWIAIPALGLGTYLLRYALLGLLANATLPPGLRRALDFVPAAVLPAITTPLLLYDASGALQSDPARLTAIGAALAVGVVTRDVLWTVVVGMAALWGAQAALAALAV